MAKRRRLEAPTAADLDQIEQEFRRETSAPDTRRAAPIAQVARETAEALSFAAQATDKADADRLREAQEKGLVMLDIPLSDINADSMIRDRSVLDEEGLRELKASIAKNGMRLPIEVYALPENDPSGAKFGLLSGYRRLRILKELNAALGPGLYETARAILRAPESDADRFAAMVEENEIRQQLSHFERGRITAVAAAQGVFSNTEAAVEAMFPAASKAKRSKIRSFAMIFEELGDLLSFPENLKEKEGLRIAGALRDGHEAILRANLESQQSATPAEEWAYLSGVLDQLETKADRSGRGGRPRKKLEPAGWSGNVMTLSSGIKLRMASDPKGYSVHMSGPGLSPELVERLVEKMSYWLDKPGS